MRGHVETLAEEIHAVRSDVSGLLRELSARRRVATDLKLQARRHPGVAGTAVALLVAGAAYIVRRKIRRRRALRDPEERVRRLETAFAKMAEDPDRVRVDGRNLVRALAMSAGTTFLTSLARRAAQETALPRLRPRGAAPAR